MSSSPLCLACGDPLELTPDGWASQDGTTCPKRPGGHLVEQIIPNPGD